MLEQCSLYSFPSARRSQGKMLILPSHFTIYPVYTNKGCIQTEVPRGSVSGTQPIISGTTLASPVNYLACPSLLIKHRLSFKQTKRSRAFCQFRRSPGSGMSRQGCRVCSRHPAAPLHCLCSPRTGLSPHQRPAEGPLPSPCKHSPSSPPCAYALSLTHVLLYAHTYNIMLPLVFN